LRFPELVRHDPFDRMLLPSAHANQAEFLTSDAFVLRLQWVVFTAQ